MDRRIWDNMAIDYDKSVENNESSIIVNYLKREIEILTKICQKICNSKENCSIIDMGAGTGRVIFEQMRNYIKIQSNFVAQKYQNLC